ncbi:MAG TPA: hypothetical protein VE078_01045 [Thermoanaerobaculia bacterium]|nr:hypothetical protein [Thermoanaerobaculia bacterium]
MMDDSDLRKLFQKAREADEALAPDFQSMRRRSADRQVTSRRLRWGLIALPAAAALAVGLGLLVAGRGSDAPSREAVSSEVSALTLDEWTAPTDFLLETPGRELLGSLPPIGASIPDVSVTDPSTKPKGT